MPLTHLVANINLTAEQQHVLDVAFSYALRKLDLVDRSDPLCDLVAKRMVDVHQRGVTSAVALAEITIREMSRPQS